MGRPTGDGIRIEVSEKSKGSRDFEYGRQHSCVYNDYAEKVLMPAMDQAVLKEAKALEAAGKYEDHAIWNY